MLCRHGCWRYSASRPASPAQPSAAMLESMHTATAASALPWLAAVADALEEAIWVWDVADGQVVLANAAFQRQYAAAGGALGAGADVLLACVHPDDVERLRRARGGLPAHGYSEEYRVS